MHVAKKKTLINIAVISAIFINFAIFCDIASVISPDIKSRIRQIYTNDIVTRERERIPTFISCLACTECFELSVGL